MSDTIYKVKSGDSLSAIASRFGVKGGYQTLASYNGIANPNVINVGQSIKIPGSSSSSVTSAPAASSSPQTTYYVKAGDTLSAIANRFGVKGGYQTLASYNDIANPNNISVGQKILIPGSSSAPAPAPAAKPASGGNASAPSPTQPVSSGPKEEKYVVKSGDTLSSIANKYGVKGGYQTLASYNGIANPNNISVGQVIKIPAGSSGLTSSGGTGGSTYKPSNGSIYNLDPTKLSKVASGANKYYSQLTGSMSIASISSRQRACCYIAQLAHESGNFYYMEEIASGEDYEGRKDLGNTQPGDGKRFKGRGPIQITGRYNYTQAAKDLGLDLVNHPELASNPEIGFKLSAWYWNKCNLNSYCDNYDFVGLTKAINGGTKGLDDRQRYYNLANQYL